MIPAIAGAIGPLGPSEWSVGSLSSGPAGAGNGNFAGTLSNAIDALEQTQAKGTQAAQQLATGHLSDPTQAVTAVENASLAMDFASQIQTKFVQAAQTVFQTQV